MFKKEPTNLDKTIEALYAELNVLTGDSPEYAATADQLVKLHALKESESKRNVVSKDVAVTVAANLVGILLIVGHERANVISSKALGFVMKAK